MRLLRQTLNFSLLLIWSLTMQVAANELSTVEQNAATCFVCHGDKGKSENPQWPSLAAQQSVYLVNQLNAFKSGKRINHIMQAQTSKLTAEDINNYGAYFAVQLPAKAGSDLAMAKQGKDKATACLSCHGPSGEGIGEFPRLAGQHPDYLAKQLTDYKNGARKNDAMQSIAGNLSEDEIKALAAFFGTL